LLRRSPHRVASAPALVLAAVLVLAACGDDDDGEQAADAPEACAEVEVPSPKQGEFQKPGKELSGPTSAVVQTSCGSFTIELDVERAPKTTSSFAGLVEQGLYDDTLIHRIEPGFVVQGGDPNGDGTGGPGYFVDEPPPQDLTYTKATVAMAKTEAEPPGRSGSQFFVVTAPADAGLPPDYALLGRVTEGYETIETIEGLIGPDGQQDTPAVIETITLQGG
jgi:cyclophilin family peptidyl-prolyl cis-trans isomerase